MQQGRVTLEADWNEAQMISGEETRKEALDFVGPAGTPDNGYAINLQPPGFDFMIGAGTMYVGGVRAVLPQTELYSQQISHDWMDWAIDGDWVAQPTAKPATNEYVYLLLREQEVSGVEDSDLKDIALGGPDTAQRTRLIQHVERLATTGTDCPSALADAEKTDWAAKGFEFDANDMRVQSFGRMEVSFVPNGTSTPCDPTAQSGYLGADNRLIRVQISNATSGALSFLWGYDDASFLYPVTVTDKQTLTLQAAPVDAEHIPQGGQAVEVLMDAAQLANGQYVAAPVGQVFKLATSSYNSDNKQLSLPGSLDIAVYGDGTAAHPSPPQVYLRVWEQQLPFTPGTAVTLGDTGLQVTLTSKNNEPFRVGDYWMFAVRPANPQLIYPERYSTPQRPDGPREWICPLGVILWSNNPPIVSDCRNLFDNLVTLTKREGGGCCTVNVTAASHNNGTLTIQQAINQVLSTGGIVCLGPGTFHLTTTLSISGATLPIQVVGEGAGSMFQVGGAVTTLVAPQPTTGVSNPAILIDASQGISIQDLELNFAPGTSTIGDANSTPVPNPGIMIQNSTCITIQRCTLACNGNLIPENPAIALGGFLGQITIRENVLQFTVQGAVGLGAGVIRLATYNADSPIDFLLTFDLYIRDNVMQCGTNGVGLDYACYHLGQVDISYNFIGPCGLVGIAVEGLGLPAPEARVEIDNNEIVGIGAGIACGLSARITNNDLILGLPASPAATDTALSGILIPPFGLPGGGNTPVTTNDGTQIVGNRITGAAGLGIWIDVPLGSAIIAENIIEEAAAGGIYVSSNLEHLSITNNQLLSLVPNASSPVLTNLKMAAGIAVDPGQAVGGYQEQGYVEIDGNIVKDLALEAGGNVSRAGIGVSGCKSTRISGNQLINIGPIAPVNTSYGITAGLLPFDQVDITGNVVRRTDSGATEENSSWRGIYLNGGKLK